jgi:hypothetical protein
MQNSALRLGTSVNKKTATLFEFAETREVS